MRDWWKFLKYNNAVPIIISLVLLSFGTSLAASPEIRQDVVNSVVSTQTKVISVDNTYLVHKNLDAYTPRASITSVQEDADFYYVSYSLATIDIKDSVWQDTAKSETLKVSKDALNGKDLGVYVTRELRQRIDHEAVLLKETQDIESKQVSQKTVATAYGGLVGKFLDDTTETLPGYVPVVVEPVSPPPQQPEVPTPDTQTSNTSTSDTGTQSTPTPSSSGGGTPPTIQILGSNPAHLELHATYLDLGVMVTDSAGHDLGHLVYLDGGQVNTVSLDTSVAAEHIIRYTATDGSGNTAEATRTVIVGNPTPPPAANDASSTPTAI